MKKCLSIALLASTLAIASGIALPCAAQERSSQSDAERLRSASYDGVWSGTIRCLYDPGLWPEDECDIGLTFEISRGALRVKQAVRSKKGEVTSSDINPGQFRFAVLGTNAIGISMDTGKDEDGTWIETWSFAMTLKDPDHMIVHWTRIVNNLDMPVSKKGSKFSSVGMGELTRRNAGS